MYLQILLICMHTRSLASCETWLLEMSVDVSRGCQSRSCLLAAARAQQRTNNAQKRQGDMENYFWRAITAFNRKSSPGSREHYRAFTSVRILSGQRRVRAPVFSGASLWVVLLWWHHQRDQKEQGSGAIKREEAGYLQREGGAFKLRRVFIKLFSRHHAGMERLHLGDSTAVGEEVVETRRPLIVTTWDMNAACHCRHQGCREFTRVGQESDSFCCVQHDWAHQRANTVLLLSPFSINFHRNLN